MNTKAYVLDLKVTSKDIDRAQPIEVGLVDLEFSNGRIIIGEPIVERCKPDEYLSFGAMASTGITNEDLINKESYRKVLSRIMPVGYQFIVAHNIGFKSRVVKNAGVDTCHYKPICTGALARYLVPNADNHKLKTLSYMFDYSFAKQHSSVMHSAGLDALACARVLRELCILGDIYSFNQLHNITLEMALPTHFTFGAYKGQSIEELSHTTKGKEYLKWVVRNVTNNPFAVESCRRILEGRQIHSIPSANSTRSKPSSLIQIDSQGSKTNGQSEDLA